jgi:hypothetical protein
MLKKGKYPKVQFQGGQVVG